MPTIVNGVPAGDQTSLSGANITVSTLRKQPTTLARRAATAVNEFYWADRFLPNVGPTSAGVITGELWSPDLAYADRKPEALAPGAEIPLAGTSVGEPIIAKAEFSGLGYEITEEMELRNQLWVLERKEIAHANTIADDFNGKAITVVQQAITTHSRTMSVPTPWDEIVVDGAAPTPTEERPHYTLSKARANNFTAKVPFKYDTMVAASSDLVELARIYPNDGITVDAISTSASLGLTLIPDTTGLVLAGAPLLVAAGGIGGTSWERPLLTVQNDEFATRRRYTMNSSASVAYIVDNPYGALKLTGAKS